jgi:hypothetical protein
MRRRQAGAGLRQQLDRPPPGQRPAAQELGERLPGDQLHGNEHLVGEGADVVHRDDVGVLQARHGLRLAQQARPAGGGGRGAQQLHRHPPVELRIVGGVDDSHAAGAQPLEHQVAPERRPALELGRRRARSPRLRLGGRQRRRDRCRLALLVRHGCGDSTRLRPGVAARRGSPAPARDQAAKRRGVEADLGDRSPVAQQHRHRFAPPAPELRVAVDVDRRVAQTERRQHGVEHRRHLLAEVAAGAGQELEPRRGSARRHSHSIVAGGLLVTS